jgi:peptidoglycan/xylan/chitin deacetylase (PgdA/CDA1 family)
MPARFILSLDCEGKWGVADALSRSHRRDLSNEKLRLAYGSIRNLLEEFRIEATFAFAGAFSQSSDDFRRIRPDIERMSKFAPNYLGPTLRDIDETDGDGWHGSHLVDAIVSSSVPHEIALHGVTHVPWTRIDASFAEAEMDLFEKLQGPVRQSRTFVYPRNLIAHENILDERRFEGFRTARGSRSRFAALLSEFNIFEAAERPVRTTGIIRIPAGYFLNWRKGGRLLVPPALTHLRARRLLERAARADEVVHYWLHPENIATAPSTLPLLRMLIEEVARLRETGHCEVMTQLGYCRWIESLT